MKDTVIGIDEAGRCPVIGPLVQAAVFCASGAELEKLKILGAIDSKKLTIVRRRLLSEQIKTIVPIAITFWSPREIDVCLRAKSEDPNMNLNLLEVKGIVKLVKQILRSAPPSGRSRIVVHRIQESGISNEGFEILQKELPNITVDVIDNESDNAAVAAASIIATNQRTWIMNLIKSKYPDVGSGEPKDKKTIAFIQKNLARLPDVVRSEWATVRKIRGEINEYVCDSCKQRSTEIIQDKDGKFCYTCSLEKEVAIKFGGSR
jgi:ribonuclease H